MFLQFITIIIVLTLLNCDDSLSKVIVTPAVYPRLVEFLHFDIQSTGQSSHCENVISDPHNAMF